ncbi:MAG: hypothetical protein WA888_21975, partial [Burkholderiaceae bacterium]
LKNDRYEHDGRLYAMGGHGIVRRRDFQLRGSAGDSVCLGFSSDEQSRVEYPFDFDLTVTFRLFDARLVIEYCVQNTGRETMPFTIGSHPAFALRDDARGIEDYQIEFSNPETLDLYQLDGTLVGEKTVTNYLMNGRVIDLVPGIFDNDALIFRNISSSMISLVNRKFGREVTVDTGGAPHLGIWSKPGGRFVCIEPWHGHSDHINATGRLSDKPDMKRLDPGYSFDAGYSITVA